jgi:hypothetical protein
LLRAQAVYATMSLQGAAQAQKAYTLLIAKSHKS